VLKIQIDDGTGRRFINGSDSRADVPERHTFCWQCPTKSEVILVSKQCVAESQLAFRKDPISIIDFI
jgi:hypothetical protein